MRCEYPECGCSLRRAVLCREAMKDVIAELRAFEKDVSGAFENKEIKGPIHLSGGNEEQLIEVFRSIHVDDWVFSTYRSHYHALLHGINPDWLMREIKAGRSMNISSAEHRFFSSAIVSGCLPIAVGVASGLKRSGSERVVWCFLGDMAATTGAFHEALKYSDGHDLPIKFVVEDNGLSCDSPTKDCWSPVDTTRHFVVRYSYVREHPHVGTGKFVEF